MNRSKVAGIYILVLFSVLLVSPFLIYGRSIISAISLSMVFTFIAYIVLIILAFFIIKEKRWAKIVTLILLGYLFLKNSYFLVYLLISYIMYRSIFALSWILALTGIILYLVGLILVIRSLKSKIK